jgi:hypothetical protein
MTRNLVIAIKPMILNEPSCATRFRQLTKLKL